MRIFFIYILSIIFALLIGCSQNNNAKKIYKVGVIQYTDTNKNTLKGFKAGLHALGFIENDNVAYINYGYANNFDEIKEKLTKIINEKPDVIYASTTPATIFAYKMTKDLNTPIVFGPVNDPVKAGIIENIASPGENITGVMLTPSDAKRLEWITVINKNAKNVLIPYNPKDKSSITTVNVVTKAAEDLGTRLIPYQVETDTDIKDLINNLPEGIDAIFMPRDGLVMSNVQKFAEVCINHKIILSTPRYEQLAEGATTGYGFVGYKLGQQAARIAATILKGAKAGDIPVETADDYFFINMEVVNKIGLDIDNTILKQAYSE